MEQNNKYFIDSTIVNLEAVLHLEYSFVLNYSWVELVGRVAILTLGGFTLFPLTDFILAPFDFVANAANIFSACLHFFYINTPGIYNYLRS